MSKTSQNSIADIEKVHSILGKSTDSIIATADATTSKMEKIMKDYERHLASFNTVTAEASTGVVEINELIASQNDKMVHISQDTRALVDYFNGILKIHLTN